MARDRRRRDRAVRRTCWSDSRNAHNVSVLADAAGRHRPAEGRPSCPRPPPGGSRSGSGCPCSRPERADAQRSKLGAPTVDRLRLRPPRPGPELLAERAWLDVRPSLLPRWRRRRARGAGDHRRRPGDGGGDPRDGQPRYDAGPIAARESFPIGANCDGAGAAVARRRPWSPRGSSTASSPTPRRGSSRRRASRRTRRRSPPGTGGFDLAPPADELVPRASGRYSPHIGARAELEGRNVTVSRARVGGSAAASRPSRCSPRAVAACPRTPGAAASRDEHRLAGPPRRLHRAAARVRRRRVCRRAFRSAAEGLDDRDRALAPCLAFGSVQRVRTLDYAIEDPRSTAPPFTVSMLPVRAALRLGA